MDAAALQVAAMKAAAMEAAAMGAAAAATATAATTDSVDAGTAGLPTEQLSKTAAAARKTNQAWRFKPRRSQFRGVAWNKERALWRVEVKRPAGGDERIKRINCGTWDDEADAGRAYDRVAKQFAGRELNFDPVTGQPRPNIIKGPNRIKGQGGSTTASDETLGSWSSAVQGGDCGKCICCLDKKRVRHAQGLATTRTTYHSRKSHALTRSLYSVVHAPLPPLGSVWRPRRHSPDLHGKEEASKCWTGSSCSGGCSDGWTGGWNDGWE